jgi:hypothetical protein
MKFFKNMSEAQSKNWNKSAVLGFYTYMVLLFIDQTYSLLFTSNLFSSSVIFWAGLIVAFGYQFILDRTTNRK